MILNKTLEKVWFIWRGECLVTGKRASQLPVSQWQQRSSNYCLINLLTLKLLHSLHSVESAIGSQGAPIGAGSQSGEAFRAGY